MSIDLPQGPISWEAAAALDEEYAKVLEREELGYDLYIDNANVLRWVPNPERVEEIMNEFGAKDLNDLFGRCNADKNDPKIRELYKAMGYSLSGFWEIFYWEVNNEDAWAYQGRLKTPVDKKRLGFEVQFEVNGDIDPEKFKKAFESFLEFGADEAENIEGAYEHKIISVERLLY